MFATLPDALRLLVVPVFAWAALRDVRTRRLPNRLWPPLYAFGALLLVWEGATLWPFAGFDGRLFLVQAAISLLFVAPLGYAFWYLGAFGGADAKALIALAILFPTFPEYAVAGTTLPLVETQIGVFSLTILTNTVLLGLAYPIGLAATNLVRGERSVSMFLARPVATDSLPDRHGRLFEDDAGPTRHGLDLDALRMYLRWRGITLADLRADPDRFRDPDGVGETFDPTDGGTHVGPRTDGGTVTEAAGESTAGESADGESVVGEPAGGDDPWAAERFLSSIDHGAYGTDAETLRGGVAVVARADRVMVSPGMPFVVPMAVGLVVSLGYGDALFALLGAVGLV
ncbi:peptidase A24A prepilin type IV [Halorubrum aidingense JCM 13560]|uniref:Peptidase A24A prepilin type IV n=1 Tax=Halorubrum aidingense JCM 13560 TaxID=1230454 RepID=M0PD30_9EURY|nr:A24 family peptidase [Halorubrum aidingense]EMA67783.1 peptidase A24A prepilin type IV [Halorubrum aidingense JCM 13560]